jgi:conjugal transfer pilus assembly protein TraW
VLNTKILKVISFAMICSVTSIQAAELQNQYPAPTLTIKDYGVHGHLFDIAEESLLKEIMAKLELAKENGTLEKLQQQFTEKVKAKVLRPTPVANLYKATTNRSWTYNPIYTQETDIIDDKGMVIIAAGTSVNALEKLKWGEPLIFIDGEDKEQIQWAKGKHGKVVLTNGAPLDLGKELNRPVYFDQNGILCRRFKIEAVPAIIEQDGLLLKVSEVRV